MKVSVIVPVFDEARSIGGALNALYEQRSDRGILDRGFYDVVVVDNGSTDGTVDAVRAFAAARPDLTIHLVFEPERGVSCARRTGMQFAIERSRQTHSADQRFYLATTDADCSVDPTWLWETYLALESSGAALAVCDYYYSPDRFLTRPRLWHAIERTLRCRSVTFALFGGFPDGKGFAVEREAYERVGGIELFYQLKDGRFVNHLSDDWDFGIKLRACGEQITYAPRARVEINPRRVDHALDDVISGHAYGTRGTIVMRDIRPGGVSETLPRDLTPGEAQQAWAFSIKDFTPKNVILPVLLCPDLLDEPDVIEFFGPDLAAALVRRIAEITHDARLIDYTPIHAYKTPSYRLYFEFLDALFERLRATVGADIGQPPPLPDCLAEVPAHRYREFVRYFCEDRESGQAHEYFGNGGVF